MEDDKATFEKHVREALTHLYDPAFLQTSPLAERIAESGEQPAPEALREMLRNAITLLRPPASVPFGRDEWLAYRVLWERFVQLRPQHTLCSDLGLSRSSYYRHQQQALAALSDMLWKQLTTADGPIDRVLASPAISVDERAIEEAVRVAETAAQVPISPAVLARGAFETLAPLALQRGITLLLELPEVVATIRGDPGILRQVVIEIAMAAMACLACQTLRLTATTTASEVVLRLYGQGCSADQAELEKHLILSRRLLAVYQGRLWIDDASSDPGIVVALPTIKRATILVADDDQETIALYRRYLQTRGYTVLVASNGAEIPRMLQEARPDLIILDVLMPSEDGWVVLQRIKTLPETADIPVIICSVLGQPSLALALGANRVLRKPLREAELLQAVREAIASYSPRAPSPAGPKAP